MKKLVLIALAIVGATFATSQAQAGVSFNIFGGSSHSRGHHDDHAPAPVIVERHHDVQVRPSYSHHGELSSHPSRPSHNRTPYGHQEGLDQDRRQSDRASSSHGDSARRDTHRDDSGANYGRSH